MLRDFVVGCALAVSANGRGLPIRRRDIRTTAMLTIFRYAATHKILHAAGGVTAGVLFGSLIPLASALSGLVGRIIQLYDLAAPFVLYAVLAPSLLRIMQQHGSGGARFSLYTTLWFIGVRVAACLFAIVAVSAIYRLPLTGPLTGPVAGGGLAGMQTASFAGALPLFGRLLLDSPYFHAIYASVATAILLRHRHGRLTRLFVALPDAIEGIGLWLTHIVPLFAFLVGVYLITMPDVLDLAFRDHGIERFGLVSMLGIVEMRPTTPHGIFLVYLAVALLTGLLCSIWHAALLYRVKRRIAGFSVKDYFNNYFVKVYPLLWATGSEAVAMPANLHLIARHYPDVQESIRNFTIGAGSVLNMNGSLICCFVLIPAVCMTIGVPVSVLSLLICLPVIYVLGFGVPGIPGELVLFAGPVMAALAVPPELEPAFLLIFLSWQIGLPDSFRSGANSTDNCPAALLLNDVYQRRFAAANKDKGT